MLSLFRRGALPNDKDAYEALSTSTPNLLVADQNDCLIGENGPAPLSCRNDRVIRQIVAERLKRLP
jgi:hypothetical protein